jgi:hypothetical protein
MLYANVRGTAHRIPGRFVVHHDEAFDFWRELVAKHHTQIDLVHIDAHADLGLGDDSSWVHIVSELLGALKLTIPQIQKIGLTLHLPPIPCRSWD